MAASLRMNADEDYHESSKYHRRLLGSVAARIRAHGARAAEVPRRPTRAWPGAPATDLPRFGPQGGLGRLLGRRRSRVPGAGAVRLAALARVLWAGQGRSSPGGRTAPSAGALYPLEVYVRAREVQGLETGWYHLDPYREVLERLPAEATGPPAWFLDDALARAPVHIVVAADLEAVRAKYGPRAYRFALLEAGHAMQNMLLMATRLRLGAVPVGGFLDDELHDEAGLDGVEEVALYAMPLGAYSPVSSSSPSFKAWS